MLAFLACAQASYFYWFGECFIIARKNACLSLNKGEYVELSVCVSACACACGVLVMLLEPVNQPCAIVVRLFASLSL